MSNVGYFLLAFGPISYCVTWTHGVRWWQILRADEVPEDVADLDGLPFETLMA